jgi:hypothetical protein
MLAAAIIQAVIRAKGTDLDMTHAESYHLHVHHLFLDCLQQTSSIVLAKQLARDIASLSHSRHCHTCHVTVTCTYPIHMQVGCNEVVPLGIVLMLPAHVVEPIHPCGSSILALSGRSCGLNAHKYVKFW